MKRAKQLSFQKVAGWGGARKGAGRPRKTKQVSHSKRLRVRASVPLHITMRLRPLPTTLRSKNALQNFRRAAKGALKFGLAINHFSLQGNHLHMIVEANNQDGVAHGMRSFGSSFGRAIRKSLGGRGAVFDGRYHATSVRTPTQYLYALRYVLLNRAHHRKSEPKIDIYSSGLSFSNWRELVGRTPKIELRDDDLPPPKSWVARVGWRRVP